MFEYLFRIVVGVFLSFFCRIFRLGMIFFLLCYWIIERIKLNEEVMETSFNCRIESQPLISLEIAADGQDHTGNKRSCYLIYC